jgi:hypothetical protein
VDDGRVFDAERKVELPIGSFPGLRLYNTEWTAPDFDESDDTIEVVASDLKSGIIRCYLPCSDFRRESSGGDWTEDDIRELSWSWPCGTFSPPNSRRASLSDADGPQGCRSDVPH